MISFSRLLCDIVGPGDYLRYGSAVNAERHDVAPRPVVVWNSTRACNLNCIHCYASAASAPSAGEMTTDEGKAFIRDIAAFQAPVLMFSGGEPLLRPDFFYLAELAADLGLRLVLSTNGTLIDHAVATRLKQIGFSEIGISLDGMEEMNDRFRGHKGAFKAALNGIRHSLDNGLRVSLRFTITRFNYTEVPAIFGLAEAEDVGRICLYHLAFCGRGSNLIHADLSAQETRRVVDTIIDLTRGLHTRGKPKEVLTVANHADGVYLYLKLLEQDPQRAQAVQDLLRLNGGNSSGIRISCVDDEGCVHPDQFWQPCSLGNIRQRPFSEIWADNSHPLLAGLRDRKSRLIGRCRECRYLDLCNGNLRARAESIHDDVWASDPACYLSDSEIGANGADTGHKLPSATSL